MSRTKCVRLLNQVLLKPEHLGHLHFAFPNATSRCGVPAALIAPRSKKIWKLTKLAKLTSSRRETKRDRQTFLDSPLGSPLDSSRRKCLLQPLALPLALPALRESSEVKWSTKQYEVVLSRETIGETSINRKHFGCHSLLGYVWICSRPNKHVILPNQVPVLLVHLVRLGEKKAFKTWHYHGFKDNQFTVASWHLTWQTWQTCQTENIERWKLKKGFLI